MTYPACTTCKRPMRNSHQRIAQHPGTVVHHGRGYCFTCHKQAPARDVDPAAIARTTNELAAYMAWRRPYREGITA